MMCSACDLEQNHKVQTVTKQGKITKAIMRSLRNGQHIYPRRKNLGRNGHAAKTLRLTTAVRKYRKGQAMTHDKFGHGEVTAVIEPQKIDVLFGDQTRRLIHAQI